jgi:PAS domain S-box-containing protein
LSEILGELGFAGNFADVWERVVHPDDKATVAAAFADAVNSGASFDIDFRIMTSGGEVRHLSAQGEVLPGPDGQPARMIGVNQDITDRKQTELALRESAQRLRVIIDSTLAFVAVLDPDGTLREINQPALQFAGLARDDVIGKRFCETFWWTHDPVASELCHTSVANAAAGRTERHDVLVRGKTERLITLDYLMAPVFNAKGEVEMLVASGFDISAREVARARAQALMGEINHRTKNILTLVQVVARMTALGGAADFIARFEERVHALAMAQDLLFESRTDTVDMADLATSQLGHFRDLLGGRIRLTGPQVALAPHAAQAIGMALHELATNAGKYGALSSKVGRIDVTRAVSTQDGTFAICWVEKDGPPVVMPKAKGFGSKVIDQMARSVLKADVALDYAPDGVEWRLICARAALTQQI